MKPSKTIDTICIDHLENTEGYTLYGKGRCCLCGREDQEVIKVTVYSNVVAYFRSDIGLVDLLLENGRMILKKYTPDVTKVIEAKLKEIPEFND